MIRGQIIDNFAGGGGASEGIRRALGRSPDIAVNHDAEAVALHTANHPETEHHCQDVWRIDPAEVAARGPIDLGWFSPDCKHFSKAKGGKPVEKHIRDLAWVVVRWAKRARPRVIMLENVEEFSGWGPLVTLEDGRQFPDPTAKGETFRMWCGALERFGYRFEHRELRACDYGAPTIRKRLFVVARCDNRPIIWPDATHAKPRADGTVAGGLRPWRSAAECIDWSIPCPSIFDRARPLAEATLRRIARGVMKYVVTAARPFIVRVDQTSAYARNGVNSIDDPLNTIATAGGMALVVPSFCGVGGRAGQSPPRGADQPFGTLTAKADGALVAASLVQMGYGEREGQAPRALDIQAPLGTIPAGGGKHALVAAFMAQHNTERGDRINPGRDGRDPLSTITLRGTQQALIAATLCHHYSSNTAGGEGDPRLPIKTITTGGHASLIYAFLVKYFGTAKDGQSLLDPLHAVTARARHGLVCVVVDGAEYVITDIGMRMLTPRELYRAQGFGDDYLIDVAGPTGKPLTKTAQIRMVGNSVCPDMAAALVRANLCGEAAQSERIVA